MINADNKLLFHFSIGYLKNGTYDRCYSLRKIYSLFGYILQIFYNIKRTHSSIITRNIFSFKYTFNFVFKPIPASVLVDQQTHFCAQLPFSYVPSRNQENLISHFSLKWELPMDILYGCKKHILGKLLLMMSLLSF